MTGRNAGGWRGVTLRPASLDSTSLHFVSELGRKVSFFHLRKCFACCAKPMRICSIVFDALLSEVRRSRATAVVEEDAIVPAKEISKAVVNASPIAMARVARKIYIPF